jgi:C4-dicarboxylate transporter DctQ subunit
MSPISLKATLERFEEFAMAFLLAFMTLLTFIQVVLRYVFNSGWVWSLEATTYAFAALVLVGMSYGVRTKSHIAVDLVTRRLPPKLRHVAAIAAVAFCLLYCGMMLYGSAIFVERLAALGNDARDIPVAKWILTLVMPLGFTLLGYRFLVAGWHVLTGHDDDMEYHEHGEHDVAGSEFEHLSESESDRS